MSKTSSLGQKRGTEATDQEKHLQTKSSFAKQNVSCLSYFFTRIFSILAIGLEAKCKFIIANWIEIFDWTQDTSQRLQEACIGGTEPSDVIVRKK